MYLHCNAVHTGALAGPPQSTPLEDVPQPSETYLANKRLEGPHAPTYPRFPAAPYDTLHCDQLVRPEGTTARFATLKTDELNSPTYYTQSSLHLISSGHPVQAEDGVSAQLLGESGPEGRDKEAALLRRDVRKVVKREMRAIVRELLKVSNGSVW